MTDADIEHDRVREAFFREKRWRAFRVWNKDVYTIPSSVLEVVDRWLTDATLLGR